jgi:hypothetical protein
MRRAAAVLASAGTVLLLTACTPPLSGDIGLGLDANGDVIALVQMCKDSVSSVVAYAEPASGTNDKEQLGQWDFDEPVSDFDTVDLGDPSSLKALIESHTVYVQAVAEDGVWRTGVIRLSPTLIDSLELGVVSDADSTASLDEFRTEACRD